MKKKSIVIILSLVLFTLILSGCSNFLSNDKTITYESQPTEVSYIITYGYKVNCTGSGKYTIDYRLDFPEVLKGQVLSTQIHNDQYTSETLAHNSMMVWNISSSNSIDYNLTITADVDAESFIVSDLNGANAFTIDEINEQYPALVAQYCQAQSNETAVFINPSDSDISETAHNVLANAGTNNSFLVAKELFKWFKQHTTYMAHPEGDNEVQTAHTTFINGTGDCDDLSFLYISLCRSVGIPSRFIRGFLMDENSAVNHAWAEVFVGGNIGDDGWIPVECAGTATADKVETEIHQNFGVESVDHLRLFKDDGSNESLNISFSGISYVRFSENRQIEPIVSSDVTSYSVTRTQQLVINEDGIRAYK